VRWRIALLSLLLAAALTTTACSSEEATPSANNGSAESAEREQRLQERLDRLEARERARDRALARERARLRKARKRAQAAKRARAAATTAPAAAVEESSSGSSGAGSIIVPDVAGLDHQAAQDALQGEGLWLLDEKDCTGQGRVLLWDRNWEVVSTDPPAGTAVNEDTTITICSKKQGE
jgi:hypothetical protein